MRTASIPALVLLRAGGAAFLIAVAAAPAHPAGQASDAADDPITVAVPGSPMPGPDSLPAGRPVAPATGARSGTSGLQSALPIFQRLLEENRAKGNREGEAEELAAMASVYRALQQEQKAVGLFQSAIAIWHELGNREYEASAIAHIGDVYREWGYPDTALRFYRKAVDVFSAASDNDGRAAALNNSGVAWLTLGDRKKCIDALNLAMASYQAIHDRSGEALAASNLGAAYIYLSEDPEKALNAFQDAVSRLEILGDRAGEANALNMMGFAFLRAHKQEMAGRAFQHARALYHDLGDAQAEARVAEDMSQTGQAGHSKPRRMSIMAGASPEPLVLTAAQLRVFEISR